MTVARADQHGRGLIEVTDWHSSESNTPVLIGPVPLLYVQSMSMSEGYKFQQIATSNWSQALAPSTKTISIEAMLIGPDRLVQKKELEALALASRVLVAAAAPALAIAGIPVVSGMTISLDMQITDLRFTLSTQKRDALDVSLSLQHVPRSKAAMIAGELADVALAAGTAVVPSLPAAGGVSRPPGLPL